MRLRPLQPRHRRGVEAAAERGRARALAVAVVGEDGDLVERLGRVASAAGTFEVVAAASADRWGTPPPLPSETDAIVLASSGSEARSSAALRELHRSNPAWRLVVVATDTSWFEEAFEVGADAWVDRTADDRTLELAITGETFLRDVRRRTSSGARQGPTGRGQTERG
jgi:DNA-binding NarL/FixJ family response regulator